MAEKENEPIKALLVAGFLGGGKTTLLRHLLTSSEDLSNTMVIVNEFGDLGIDGSFLQGDSSDVVELTSGCICCTLVLDLERTLLAVPERFSPRRIFIEAPGVADPQGIRSAPGFKGLRGRVSLYRAVTVLDVKLWRARPMLGRVFWAPNASPGFSTPCLSGFSASRAGSDSPKKRASATTWGGRPAGPTWETLGTRNWPSWPGTRTPGPCWNGWSRAGSGLRFPNPPSPESGSRKRRRTHSRRKARFPASAPDRFWHLPPDSRRPDSAVVSSPHS